MKLKNLNEAAAIMRISTATLRRLIRQGRFPCHRISRKIFFTQSDIETGINGLALPADARGGRITHA